jgi:cyclohexanone monooxygenase
LTLRAASALLTAFSKRGRENGFAMKQVEVVIVGAGFAGMLMLYQMRKAGRSAVCLEAAPSVGGTWYHNRYPGARVDIESLEYSYSFSEQLQQEWKWTERYSAQPELLRYANHVADRFELRKNIELNTRVKSAEWFDDEKRWHIESVADGYSGFSFSKLMHTQRV